tara:strand:- start:3691 stop:4032 length:342 start_codon:yes stop_codon:yes gene_type:complete
MSNFGLFLAAAATVTTVVVARRRRRPLVDCTPISRSRHRRRLIADGINMTGVDVGHIVARQNGGPDVADNFYPIDSSLNRSWQHENDDLMCKFVGRRKCRRARRAAQHCRRQQ